MNDLKQFVDDAKAKGLGEEKIRELLVGGGWSQSQIDAALLGIEVPKAPDSNLSASTSRVVRAAVHPLEAALQHILLWVFTGTSSIMIGVVTNAIFGEGSTSSEPLLAYLVLELVTYVPFAVLFVLYLRKLRKMPELTTGKVWSIITIVFHSLGAMGALISLLLAIILVPTDGSVRTPVVVASLAIGVMDIVVLAAYVMANFTRNHTSMLKHWLLIAFPAVLFVIVAVFGAIALANVGPLRADDQTRKDLVQVASAVSAYTQQHGVLPSLLSQTTASDVEQVTYAQKTSGMYQLCAEFQHETSSSVKTIHSDYLTGAYVSEYSFNDVTRGKNCWTLYASSYSFPTGGGVVPQSSPK